MSRVANAACLARLVVSTVNIALPWFVCPAACAARKLAATVTVTATSSCAKCPGEAAHPAHGRRWCDSSDRQLPPIPDALSYLTCLLVCAVPTSKPSTPVVLPSPVVTRTGATIGLKPSGGTTSYAVVCPLITRPALQITVSITTTAATLRLSGLQPSTAYA